MQDQAHLIGVGAAARGAVAFELRLVQLDQVLGLTTGATQRVIDPLCGNCRLIEAAALAAKDSKSALGSAAVISRTRRSSKLGRGDPLPPAFMHFSGTSIFHITAQNAVGAPTSSLHDAEDIETGNHHVLRCSNAHRVA